MQSRSTYWTAEMAAEKGESWYGWVVLKPFGLWELHIAWYLVLCLFPIFVNDVHKFHSHTGVRNRPPI